MDQIPSRLRIFCRSCLEAQNFAQSSYYDHQGILPPLGGSPTNPRMATNKPKDGHPNKEVHYMEFGTCTLHTKLTPGDSCHGWSPAIPWRVIHQPKDGQPPTQGWSAANPRMVTHQKEVYYRLGIWHFHFTPKTNTRWQLQCTVTYHPLEGHPPTHGWSPTKRKCTTDLEFGTFTLLTKLTLGDNCHGWSPSIHRMITYLPKDGHPLEGSVLKTGNFALRLNTQT